MNPDLSKNWVYWLDETQPDPTHVPGQPPRYRVSVVVEHDEGHWPMGDPKKGQAPWYWDKEACAAANRDRGFNEWQVWEIIMSSMNAARRK